MFVLLLLACTAEPDTVRQGTPEGHDTATDTGDTGDTGGTTATGCHATPAAADRDRTVVLAHPYDGSGGQADAWVALTLRQDGALSGGEGFTMGRASWGEVVFTPDGQVGFAVQDDGTIGVFTVDQGQVTVVQAAWEGAAYATRVVADPSGEILWIVDGNWANNGGGVYRADIDCETGALSGATRVIEAKMPADLLLTAGGRALLVGREVPGSTEGDDAALLDWSDSPTFVAGVDAFGDDEAIVSDAALTADGRLALIGDSSAFSGIPNRVAVIDMDGPTAAQVLSDIEDPVAILTSPFNDAALVVSGYGDALFVLGRDGDTFTDLGEPAYVGASPALPGGAVMVERGALTGLVLVAENQGIRPVRFDGEGGVTDLGLVPQGDGLTAISGAIGVQP